MENFKMNKSMESRLDTFLANKTITDVDRTTYLILNLEDVTYGLNTCLVFANDLHSFEDPTIVTCEYTGAVIHLPGFWVEIPKPLAFTYICKLINDLYDETYLQWYQAGFIGSAAGSSTIPSNPNCNCPCGPTGGYTMI